MKNTSPFRCAVLAITLLTVSVHAAGAAGCVIPGPLNCLTIGSPQPFVPLQSAPPPMLYHAQQPGYPYKWVSNYEGYPGLLEARIPFNKVQYRPLFTYSLSTSHQGDLIRSPHFDRLFVLSGAQSLRLEGESFGDAPQASRDDCQQGSSEHRANSSQSQNGLVVRSRPIPDAEDGRIIVYGTLALLMLFPGALCLGYWLGGR